METQRQTICGDLRAIAIAVAGSSGADRDSTVKQALDHWREVLCGRWLLYGHFLEDGRLYVLMQPGPPKPERCRGLSTRERQVVAGVVLGLSNKEIAYRLKIAETTVATHLRRALAKLGLGSRVELIRLVPRHALDTATGADGVSGLA